jgi:hypothetical protein
MSSSWVALVRADASEELSSSIIMVTRIGELGTYRFLQEPHGVRSQKTALFIVTAVKTTNLTTIIYFHNEFQALSIAFIAKVSVKITNKLI